MLAIEVEIRARVLFSPTPHPTRVFCLVPHWKACLPLRLILRCADRLTLARAGLLLQVEKLELARAKTPSAAFPWSSQIAKRTAVITAEGCKYGRSASETNSYASRWCGKGVPAQLRSLNINPLMPTTRSIGRAFIPLVRSSALGSFRPCDCRGYSIYWGIIL
jgi:hypothetical protein